MPEFVLRYHGRLVKVAPRPYEPERQTTDVAWLQIKEGISAEEAYRRWFEKQRRISRLLQQCTGSLQPQPSSS